MSRKGIKRIAKLTKKDFHIYQGDVTYFQTIFGIHNQYQLAFEPCDNGFDVSLYWKKHFDLNRVGEKKCTQLPGYDRDPFHELPRGENAWKKALELAEQVIDERLPKGVER